MSTIHLAKQNCQDFLLPKLLYKVSGIHSSLEASGEGPYKVQEKPCEKYHIVDQNGQHLKTVHINSTKKFPSLKVDVSAVCVIPEKHSEMCKDKCVLSPTYNEGFDQSSVDQLLVKFSSFFSDKPGLCSTGECVIEIDKNSEVVNKPPRWVPIVLHEAVSTEVDRLLDAGIIVPSDSQWSNPTVSVKEPSREV